MYLLAKDPVAWSDFSTTSSAMLRNKQLSTHMWTEVWKRTGYDRRIRNPVAEFQFRLLKIRADVRKDPDCEIHAFAHGERDNSENALVLRSFVEEPVQHLRMLQHVK